MFSLPSTELLIGFPLQIEGLNSRCMWMTSYRPQKSFLFFFTSVQSSLKSELMAHMERQDEQVKAFLWTLLWSNYEIITLN